MRGSNNATCWLLILPFVAMQYVIAWMLPFLNEISKLHHETISSHNRGMYIDAPYLHYHDDEKIRQQKKQQQPEIQVTRKTTKLKKDKNNNDKKKEKEEDDDDDDTFTIIPDNNNSQNHGDSSTRRTADTSEKTSATTITTSINLEPSNKPNNNNNNDMNNDNDMNNNNINNINFDIISIGSKNLLTIQNTQEKTMGSRYDVRKFYRINEYNDTESKCHTDLTINQVQMICEKCSIDGRNKLSGNNNNTNMMNTTYPLLYKLSNSFMKYDIIKRRNDGGVGWFCAQKRPIDGLYSVLQQYKKKEKNTITNTNTYLPEYLIIMDDDTWIDIDKLKITLSKQYISSKPYAIAGCLTHWGYYSAQIGGYSLILTKKVIKRFITPIYCNNNGNNDSGNDNSDSDPQNIDDNSKETNIFINNVCKQIYKNEIGEKPLFTNGMSISDLMYKYTFSQPYMNVDKWNDIGYCFHSDLMISYYINHYNLAIEFNDDMTSNNNIMEEIPKDYNNFQRKSDYKPLNIQPYNGSIYMINENFPGSGECRNRNDWFCNEKSTFCHTITSEEMLHLHINDHHYYGYDQDALILESKKIKK